MMNRLLFGALALVFFQASSFAQTQVTPIPFETLQDTRNFGEYQPLQFSPDGKWVCYAVRDVRQTSPDAGEAYATGVPWFGNGSSLWVVNIENGQSVELTREKGNNWLPSWSPDGRYLAFYSDRGATKKAELWLMDMMTRQERRVTDLEVRWRRVQWTPDGKQLLVLANPEGMTSRQLAERIVPSKAPEMPVAVSSGTTVKVYRFDPAAEQKPGASGDPWNLDTHLGDLALVDVATGKVQRISSGRRVPAYWISPDGSKIAYTVTLQFEKLGSQQILFDLTVFDRATGQTRVVAPRIRLFPDGKLVQWLPSGTALSYRSEGPAWTGDVYVIDLKNGTTRKIELPSEGRQRLRENDLLWDDSGERAYFGHRGDIWRLSLDQNRAEKLTAIPNHYLMTLNRGNDRLWSPDGGKSTVVLTIDDTSKQSGFYKVDLASGQASPLMEANQSIAGQRQRFGYESEAVVSPDGKHLVYVEEDAQHSRDLWIADASFRDPRRLTHINPELDRYVMGAGRLIEWRSLDGQPLQGALLLPAGYREGQKYPLIVHVYPNEMGSDDLNTFGFDGLIVPGTMQLLATRGYAILFPDAPVRTGVVMADLVKTVVPGADRVVEMGIADPDRIGVMGHSAGGYSTLALITQTTRFKAAVMGDGFGNEISVYGAMAADGTAYGIPIAECGRQTGNGGTPWEVRSRYIENSPIFYLDRVQTPLLIYHGSEDNAVPAHLADEVFVDLRRLGKTVSYAKYMGEAHVPVNWQQANQVDLFERIIAWFDKYLRNSR